MKKSGKSIIALALSLALLCNYVFVGTAFNLSASPVEAESKTAGQVLAENYDFITVDEAAVLANEALVGTRFTYVKPTDSDSLVTIDSSTKTVTAANYNDGTNTWVPVSAAVVYSDGTGAEQRDAVTLTAGEGTYTTSVDKYRIEVTYALNVEMAEADQRAVLQLPAVLADGVVNMNKLDARRNNINTIAKNIGTLYSLVDGSIPLGSSGIPADSEVGIAITSLYNECAGNDGKFYLYNYLRAYFESTDKLAYVMENGAAVKDALNDFCPRLDTIANAENVDWKKIAKLCKKFGYTVEAEEVSEGIDVLKEIYADLDEINADAWLINAGNLVTADASQSDLAALSTDICTALDGGVANTFSAHDEEALQTTLCVDTATVSAGVDQYKVNVTVTAKVQSKAATDAVSLETLPLKRTTSVVLDKDSTKQQILDAVLASGVEADAVDTWTTNYADYNIGSTYYNIVTSDLPDALTEDIDYTITYEPKNFEVTYDYKATNSLPYGYTLTLPVHDEEDKSYDYKVNGTAAQQGSKVVIAAATAVTRTESGPIGKYRVSALLADSNLADGLSAAEVNVLRSLALTDNSLWMRLPDDESGVVSVQPTANANIFHVVCSNYASGLLSGGVWQATSLVVVEQGDVYGTVYNVTDGAVDIDLSDVENFDHVEVSYQLDVSDVSVDTINMYLDLAHNLVADAAAQKTTMDSLANDSDLMNGLGEVSEYIGLISLISQSYSPEAQEAVEYILDNCVDADDNMYLYSYLTNYKASGLTYYYTKDNARLIETQVTELARCLNVLWADPQFQQDLTIEYVAPYTDRLNSLRNKLSSVTFTELDENIDTYSPYISGLVAAINAAAGNTADHADVASAAFTTSTTVNATLNDRTIVALTTKIVNSNGEAVATATKKFTFAKGVAVTAANVTEIETAIGALATGLAVDTAHYEATVTGNYPAVGDVLSADRITYKTVYTPVTYTANVEGAAAQTFAADALYEITLPASTDASVKYSYTIGNDTVEVGATPVTYTFASLAAVDSLFGADRTLDIARENIDVNREMLFDLTEKLNAAVAEKGMTFKQDGRNCLTMAFIPYEDANGNVTIVMRLSPHFENAEEALTGLAEVLISSGVDYIGIGGEGFWSDDCVTLQTLVDFLLDSDLSFDYVADTLIDENGDIYEITEEIPELANLTAIGVNHVDGIEVRNDGYINDTGVLGGRIALSTLQVGISKDSCVNVPFYFTIEDFDKSVSNLTSVRDALIKVRPYVNVACEDGDMNIDVNVPDKYYPYALMALLGLDLTDLADATNFDIGDVADYFAEMALPVTGEEFSAETVERTADMIGKDLDLSEYSDIIETARMLLNNVLRFYTLNNGSQVGSVYSAVLNYDIKELITQDLDVSDIVTTIIKEASGATPTGINVDFNLDLHNMDTEYEALIVDLGASGVDKVRMTTDLAAATPTLHENSVVILLKNVDLGSTVLKFNKAAYFDLNGHNLTGTVQSTSASVYMVDSNVDTLDCGTFTGTLDGKNIFVTGGRYLTPVGVLNVKSHLKSGYKQDTSGVVRPKMYTVDVVGDTVNILLEGDFFKGKYMPNLKSAAIDVAADMLLDYYNAAALITVDGYNVFTMDVQDAVSYFENTSASTALKNIVKDIVNNMVDTTAAKDYAKSLDEAYPTFASLADRIENNEDLFSCTIDRAAWKIALSLEGNADNNHIKVDVVPADEVETVNLKVNYAADATQQQKDDMVAFLDELDSIVTVNQRSLSVKNFDYDVNDLTNYTLDLEGTIDVTFDLSKNRNYAAMLCVAMANVTTGTFHDELVDAVDLYLLTGATEELKTAFEKATVDQFKDGVELFNTKTFAQMVEALNLTGSAENVIELADLYENDSLQAMTVLAQGTSETKSDNRTFGQLATAAYGEYDITTSFKGEQVVLTLKLFRERSDIEVRSDATTVIFETDDLSDAFKHATTDGYIIHLNESVLADDDCEITADLIVDNGTYLMDMGDKKLVLMNTDASLSADFQIAMDILASDLPEYKPVEALDGGVYTYTLAMYDVVVTDANDAVIYASDDLSDALANAADGSTVTVNNPVTLDENTTVSVGIEIVNADDITFGANKISLGDAAAQIKADADLSDVIDSALPAYVVDEAVAGSDYTYTLRINTVLVTDASGNLVLSTTDLAAAFAAAADGYTITVNNAVTLEADVTVTAAIKLVGTALITWNGKTVTLNDEAAKLTADAALADGVVVCGVAERILGTSTVGTDTVYTVDLLPTLDNPIINIQADGDIRGGRVDTENKYIIIDTDPAGIDWTTFGTLVTFAAHNADTEYGVQTPTTNGKTASLVCTGDTVTATATKGSYQVSLTYTVVVIGDVNANGRCETGDATAMMNSFFGSVELTGPYLMAADTNANGVIDSGDATKICNKWLYAWTNKTYVSKY